MEVVHPFCFCSKEDWCANSISDLAAPPLMSTPICCWLNKVGIAHSHMHTPDKARTREREWFRGCASKAASLMRYIVWALSERGALAHMAQIYNNDVCRRQIHWLLHKLRNLHCSAISLFWLCKLESNAPDKILQFYILLKKQIFV